ncbi:hypothetical protein N9A30_08140, partial [Flavobacteriaceae bacterium]|nr:hypothetical protein [Flavobacteriaceae bacterium]
MKKYSFIVLLVLMVIVSSCVSTKVFNDLESRYSVLKMERRSLEKSRDSTQQAFDLLNQKWQETEGYLQRSRDSVSEGLSQLKILRKEYALLEQNSDQKIQESIGANNALLKEIAVKEAQLLARSERVDQLEL